jgi:hypothetical protein
MTYLELHVLRLISHRQDCRAIFVRIERFMPAGCRQAYHELLDSPLLIADKEDWRKQLIEWFRKDVDWGGPLCQDTFFRKLA